MDLQQLLVLECIANPGRDPLALLCRELKDGRTVQHAEGCVMNYTDRTDG